MKLTFKNRYTKYIERPKDIAMIEIKETDEIYNALLLYSHNLISLFLLYLFL